MFRLYSRIACGKLAHLLGILVTYYLATVTDLGLHMRKSVPQAKISFDLSPVEVVVRMGERRWYDFMTSIFAIIGAFEINVAKSIPAARCPRRA